MPDASVGIGRNGAIDVPVSPRELRTIMLFRCFVPLSRN